MARFYVDGEEVDVSDPLFYLPLCKVDKLIQQLTDYKNDNMPYEMGKGPTKVLPSTAN